LVTANIAEKNYFPKEVLSADKTFLNGGF